MPRHPKRQKQRRPKAQPDPCVYWIGPDGKRHIIIGPPSYGTLRVTADDMKRWSEPAPTMTVEEVLREPS